MAKMFRTARRTISQCIASHTSVFVILLVNYRGSLGFGQDNILSLLGNVGSQDVKDVQVRTKEMTVTPDRHFKLLLLLFQKQFSAVCRDQDNLVYWLIFLVVSSCHGSSLNRGS